MNFYALKQKTHLTQNRVGEFLTLYGGGGGNRTRVRRGLHDSLYECSLGFNLGLPSSPGPDLGKPYPLVFPLCSRETSGKWVDGVVHARYTSADEGERTHRTRRREPNYLRQLMFESFDFFTSFRQLDSQPSAKHLPVETGTPPSFFRNTAAQLFKWNLHRKAHRHFASEPKVILPRQYKKGQANNNSTPKNLKRKYFYGYFFFF